jgi:chemotaxis protein histidine kinase CheA
LHGIERGLREVRERFLDRLDERLDRIRLSMSLAPGDPVAVEDLRREIHSLIGSAGTLGFHDLAAAAEASERTMRDGDAPMAVAERLAVLIACVEAYTRQRAHA